MQKLLLRVGVAIVALALAVALAGYLTLRASLPPLDGHRTAAGLGAEATLARDTLGVVTVSAHRPADLAYALGFAHGGDRLFQMDLLRRVSAGELAALLGPSVVATDREFRVHRLRAVARAAVERLPPADRALLEAYTAGVNAAIDAASARPFEYFLLGSRPERWRAEDSVLCVLTMFIDLQGGDGHRKLQRGLIYAALPPAAARFVYAEATDWEAPIDGSHGTPPVVPTAAEYDLGALGDLDFGPPSHRARAHGVVGSNNWALAGRRTASGAALVANDMHLGIRVPNTWYRARLTLSGGESPAFDLTGVTLPGTPAVVAGSNGHVAWGFTNSYGDYQDVVVAVPDPEHADRYLTPSGSRPFTHARERIDVHGAPAVELDVTGTEWGPVVGRDAQGRALVLEWTAHQPEALNFRMLALETADSVASALDIAAGVGIPAQNFVVGDAAGHIGWTIAGQIPRRRGGDASLPRLSTDPTVGFDGWVPPAEHPRVVDPAPGQIATANARVVGGDALAIIGDGGYDRGARQGRAAADLAKGGDHQTPADMLRVQLDDSAVLLAGWQRHLLETLDGDAVAGHARRAELRQVLAGWTGHAAIDDAAYRLVRAFRDEVEERVFHALIAPARAANPAFRFRPPSSFEGPLWLLVTTRPPHLVPPGSANWHEFELVAVDAALAALDADCPVLAQCTWGKVNRMRIRHPLSGAVPLLAHLTDIPSESLPGDRDMPRVIGPDFGASERFAVAPGHEAEAYFHMPGGQSGHPLSPYFHAGYAAWAHGTPTPFLPGPAEHTLVLGP
jgi:penicillin amidase